MDASDGRVQETLTLPGDLAERLRTVAERQSATSFMLYLAAFYVLLYKCTNETGVLINIYSSGRASVDLENVIGFFARRVLLHKQIDPEQDFSTLLAETRDSVLEILVDTDVAEIPELLPLEAEGVRGLRPAVILFRHFDRAHDHPLQFAGLGLERILTPPEGGHLTMHVSERRREPTRIKLSSESLDDTTLQRLLRHHRRLLEAVAAEPRTRVRQLELLSRPELQQLRGPWDKVKNEPGTTQCLHHLIALQAEQTPDAVAVRSQHGSVTYRDLDDRATKLARELRVRGVERAELVAVAIPPSAELLIAMLGIWKIGGTCLPVDATRNPHVADMPGATRVLVVNGPVPPSLQDFPVTVDLATNPDQHRGDAPTRESTMTEVAELDCPALVVQTAGVTQRSKYVQLTHRAMAHVALAHQRAYKLHQSDRAFYLPGPGAQAWALAPWSCLAIGAEVLDPADLGGVPEQQVVNWLADEGATVAALPAPVASELLARDVTSSNSSLRTVIAYGCGSLAHHPSLQVFRQFTIAEAGGFALSARLKGDADERMVGDSVSSSAKAYVLGPDLKPMPQDEVGELWLGGAGLADCYLGSSNETETAFIADPLDIGEARIVRTGDLARQCRDGRIEFCGRSHDEVRFRGFRLNTKMQQLESTLASNPAVAYAATRWDQESQQLVAYVVPRRAVLPHAHDLNRWVCRTMGDWILPVRYIVIDDIPTRPCGDIDREALGEKAGRPLAADPAAVASQSTVERRLLSIWKKVLKQRRIGVTDNFFGLGGDLVSGYEMIARAAQAGLTIAIEDLIAGPTIAELATMVSNVHEPGLP
jgi:non-ribosomal peptide synthetase component F